MEKLLKILFHHLEEILCIVFFVIMIISLFLQIVSRLLGMPFSFTEEVSRFTYIWITFIGFSYGTKLKTNISVTFFSDFFNARVKRILGLFFAILELAVFVFLLYWSIKFCQFTSVLLSPALELSMCIVNISLPIGLSLAIVRSLYNISKDYFSKKLESGTGD